MKLGPLTIRTWRIEQGMTQEEMASLLGVGSSTVSRWERDVTSQPKGTSEMILKALIFKDSTKCEQLYSMLKGIFANKMKSK